MRVRIRERWRVEKQIPCADDSLKGKSKCNSRSLDAKFAKERRKVRGGMHRAS
jgi:hypothetical protein